MHACSASIESLFRLYRKRIERPEFDAIKEVLTISIYKCLWFLEKQKGSHLSSYAQVNFPELCTIG